MLISNYFIKHEDFTTNLLFLRKKEGKKTLNNVED